MFHPFELPVELPATMICGKKEGMTLLVTTQIHAGEYNGSAASIRLAREIDPDCFMIVSRVTEVWGRGFTYSKKYTERKPS